MVTSLKFYEIEKMDGIWRIKKIGTDKLKTLSLFCEKHPNKIIKTKFIIDGKIVFDGTCKNGVFIKGKMYYINLVDKGSKGELSYSNPLHYDQYVYNEDKQIRPCFVLSYYYEGKFNKSGLRHGKGALYSMLDHKVLLKGKWKNGTIKKYKVYKYNPKLPDKISSIIKYNTEKNTSNIIEYYESGKISETSKLICDDKNMINQWAKGHPDGYYNYYYDNEKNTIKKIEYYMRGRPFGSHTYFNETGEEIGSKLYTNMLIEIKLPKVYDMTKKVIVSSGGITQIEMPIIEYNEMLKILEEFDVSLKTNVIKNAIAIYHYENGCAKGNATISINPDTYNLLKIFKLYDVKDKYTCEN